MRLVKMKTCPGIIYFEDAQDREGSIALFSTSQFFVFRFRGRVKIGGN